MRSIYINKEQTPAGYYLPERTVALCDSPFCAEVCSTGIIYRGAYQNSAVFQPPFRYEGYYGTEKYYDNAEFKSFGQVAPCTIEFKIETLNPNGFLTDTSDIINTYSGIYYSDTDIFYISSADHLADYNQQYYTKRWLVPFCRDDVLNKTGLAYAIVYLGFDSNDNFTFENNASRNVYINADLYIGNLLEHNYTKTLSVRGLAGSIKYAKSEYSIQSSSSNIGYSSGYYDSSVFCTGWNNLVLNTTTYNQGLFQNSCVFKITSKNSNNIDDSALFAFDSYNKTPLCNYTPTSSDNDSSRKSNLFKVICDVDTSGYIYYYDLPNYYEININITGEMSSQLAGRHKLTSPLHQDSAYPFSKRQILDPNTTTNDPYSIYRSFGGFVKELAMYDYAPSGYLIIDDINGKYGIDAFPEYHNNYLHDGLGISRIQMTFSTPTPNYSGESLFGGYGVISGIPSGLIYII